MLDLVQAYENYLTKVKQASANTVSSYMRDIRQFAAWLANEEGTEVVDAVQSNIADYFSYMETEGRSGATLSRSLASLKNFYAYVVSSGFLEQSPVVDVHVERGEILSCRDNSRLHFRYIHRYSPINHLHLGI